jgi:Cu(I)/Ag(I) efflux system membrane protein CusA/SilA
MTTGSGPVKHGFIENLIEYCAANRFLVIILVAILVVGGILAMRNVPLDAIPDLSDTQVILLVQWMGRDPQLVEDQITYPLVSSLLAAPKVKVVRGFSDFSMAFVYVIFEDGTDIYWARSRVVEYLSKIQGRLPADARVEIGPDASGLGWVFQYALRDKTGRHDLADLRSLQDWNLRYALEGIEGVAEVASLGGYVRSYQIEVDPNALAARGLSIHDVMARVRDSNRDVGGRVVEMAGREHIVRGIGYVASIEDLEEISLDGGAAAGPADGMAMSGGAVPSPAGRAARGGAPTRLRDVARVTLGPDLRRGIAELDGEGEVVGGIVVIRHGENALNVIRRVKERIEEEIRPTLPPGVELITVYDRSDLILGSIETLKATITKEMIVVAVVIVLFLLHLPSAAVPVITIPVAVILSFIPMWYYGVTSNIMSLGGIAVAIGALVDASIVVVENVHKKLAAWEDDGRPGSRRDAILEAVKEVGRPSFFSLLVIAVSFFPVFALTGQEGRLFRPLALTKNLAMAISAVLAVTLVPAIIFVVFREKEFRCRPRFLAALLNMTLGGKPHREEAHPVSRFLQRVYAPVCRFGLEWPKAVILAAVLLVLVTVPIYLQLGSEFMPPLWEGSFLYMPSTPVPGASTESARRAMTAQDRLIREHPAVATVFGKVGRAVTATDPAPLTMVETTITLKDESAWPRTREQRWYSGWAPEGLKHLLRRFWPEERPYDWKEIKAELDARVRVPGWPNIWTMPIEARINMLTTGIRSPVGIKIFGDDLEKLDEAAERIAAVVRRVPGATSVVTEPILGAPYIDIRPDRAEIARYGLTMEEVNRVVESAIGGMTIMTTVEGRERYPIQIRYPRELRDDPERLARVLVPTPRGQIPLGQLAAIGIKDGPAMIKNEDGALAAYINVDFQGASLGDFVGAAKEAVRREIVEAGLLPPGYRLSWSGMYEFQERANRRLAILVPATLAIVFLLLYINTGSLVKTSIVFGGLSFSVLGAIWFIWLLDYNLSVAVWVGLIALLGLDAETSVFMLLYLDLACDEAKRKGRMRNIEDLKEALFQGAVMRVRPKVMTVATTFLGLLPLMFATGAGADVMKRIAAPLVGGLASTTVIELVVVPAVYLVWKRRSELRSISSDDSAARNENQFKGGN